MVLKGVDLDIRELEGESVDRVFIIKAEYGRTCDNYLGVICKSGRRFLCGINNRFHDPEPALQTMEECEFFTVEEVSSKAEKDATKRRKHAKEAQERERKHYEDLKKKYGDKS